MYIKNIQSETNNLQRNNNKQLSYKGAREIVRTLANPDSLATTMVLETSVTGGRSVNAYKRGGFAEFRERITDDILAALFWMKGVDIFNKLGDKFGKHVLKLPTTEFDVGKDALRTPFENLVQDLGDKVDAKSLKKLEKKLAAFKFSKIIISSIMATAFVGFALPKINQAITKRMFNKNKSDNKPTLNDMIQDQYTIENFNKKIGNSKETSFKGSASVMTTVAHMLENNRLCKMMTADVGITAGRYSTARNKDEGLEYVFRDVSSCFFYYASTPLIYKLLQKITKSKAFTTIDPVAAKSVHQIMLDQLKNADGTFRPMNVKEFAAKTIGVLDDGAKELLQRLPFNSDVISLSELKNFIKDENLLKKAMEMAKLQPEKAGVGAVLTKQQVCDVLKNGAVNTPEFMQEVYKSRFGRALTDSHRFIPMKKITAFRDNIDDYAKSIIEAAKGGDVTKELLEKVNKKSFFMSAGFRFFAMAVSALALGVIIPKVQYYITKKRTGSNAAPGLREYEKDEKKS